MAANLRTIHVEQFNHQAMKLTWQYEINKADLHPAFHELTMALTHSSDPMYIIVDLSQDPQLPVLDTMMEALRGPFRHPKLAEWLVLGSNRSARWIADLLIRTASRNNIRWFNTMDEITAYLSAVEA